MTQILDAANLFASNSRTQETTQAAAKPKAKVWLNVGIMMAAIDPATGEEIQELLTFPVNLPIDTMTPREVPRTAGKTATAKQYRDRIIASNALLERIKEVGNNLEGGDVVTLNGFTLQLQKVQEEDTVSGTTTADNAYMAQLSTVMNKLG